MFVILYSCWLIFYRRARSLLAARQIDAAWDANNMSIIFVPLMPVAGMIDGHLIGYLF